MATDPLDIKIVGADNLAKLGRRFKAEGEGDLRKRVLAGIRTAVAKIIPDIQRETSILPHGGGLAEEVAGQKFAVRTSLTSGKVTLTGSGMKSMTDIDAGRLRHPVEGNRDVWVQQSVTPGFFSKPVAAGASKIREEVESVMSDVAKKLEKPL